MYKMTAWERYTKCIEIVVILGTFTLAGWTLHDMQTAEGTGLYLSLRANAESCAYYDLFVDSIGILALSAVSILPCVVLRRLRPESLLRFLAAYLAFLPTISTAALVHLLDGTDIVMLRDEILKGQLGEALMKGLGGSARAFSWGLPLLILTVAAQAEEQQSITEHAKTVSRKIAALAAMSLLILAILFPVLTEHCVYLIQYCLLLYGFAMWEKLYDNHPKLRFWGGCLFALFWLRGIGRMMDVMSVYHI